MSKKKQENKTETETDKERLMPLTFENYKWMLVGFALIVVGFVLMLGGKNAPDEFDYRMFSFRRITLAPILVLAGFVVEIYAIMKRPKNRGK